MARPGSQCPGCHRDIAWYDNLPVLSYLFLLGRCRHCKTRISLRYPAVELLTGGLFLGTLFWSQGHTASIFFVRISIVLALITVTFIDLDHFIIPDVITLPGIALGPVISYFVPQLHSGTFFSRSGVPDSEQALFASLAGIIAGAGAVYLVGVIGKIVFRKEAMGLGDVKLMGAMGGFLGTEAIVAAFFLGAALGAFFGVGNVLLIGFGRTMRLSRRGWPSSKAFGVGMRLGRRLGSYIPFGPFLSIGCLVLLFWKENFFEFALEVWPRWIRGIFGLN